MNTLQNRDEVEVCKRELLKLLCFVLRHNPRRYRLCVTPDGFVPLEALVAGLYAHRKRFAAIWSQAELLEIVIALGLNRFEVKGDHIRACYGHSFPVPEIGEESVPPEILFHGTSDDAYELIWKHGLHPMDRYFLHLTTDREYALRVGEAKGNACLWSVKAQQAFESGIIFRKANSHVWLTSEIPPKFLSVEAELVNFADTV
jgi:putative RNA 2'-phosphotransferase